MCGRYDNSCRYVMGSIVWLMAKMLDACAIAPRQLDNVQQVRGKIAEEEASDESVRVRLGGPTGLLSSLSEPPQCDGSAVTDFLNTCGSRRSQVGA